MDVENQSLGLGSERTIGTYKLIQMNPYGHFIYLHAPIHKHKKS